MDHLSSCTSVPLSSAARFAEPRAVHITLRIQDNSPLLAVDPRAGNAVAMRLRRIHGRGHRLLAWSVLADHAQCLITTSRHRNTARLVSELMDRSGDDLARLGHHDVWSRPAALDYLHTEQGLRQQVIQTLLAPELAGLSDSWHRWRWVGSEQWPHLAPSALSTLVPGLLWLDALTSDEVTWPHQLRQAEPSIRRPR